MEILNDSVKSFEKLYLQLQDGFPVIVPTDTNYNLCSLPNNDLCIDKIFEYKKRSKDKPLSLFIDKPEDWKLYGDNQNTEIVDKLVEIFHAGALLPITSFGHSLMHGALAATKEFGVFGLAMGIFDLTAAGISSAILFAFLVAICTKPKS